MEMSLRWRKASIWSLAVHCILIVVFGFAVGGMTKAPQQEEYIEVSLVKNSNDFKQTGKEAGSVASADKAQQSVQNSQPQQQMQRAVTETMQTVPVTEAAGMTEEIVASVPAHVSVPSLGATEQITSGGESSGVGTGTIGGAGNDGGASGGGDDGAAGSIAEHPTILSSAKPKYPMRARRNGIEGHVVLRVEILSNGQPGDISIKSSSGDDSLDEAAINAVNRWRFTPARNGLGQAVDCYSTVPIDFSLN